MNSVSILLTTPEPAALLRTAWGIAMRRASVPVEVVVASERPEDAESLRMFSSAFLWKFALLGGDSGDRTVESLASHEIVKQDGRCIPWDDAYQMLLGTPDSFGSVFDLPAEFLPFMDKYGSNVTDSVVKFAMKSPVYTDLFQDGEPLVKRGSGVVSSGGVFLRQPGEAFDFFSRTDIREVVTK